MRRSKRSDSPTRETRIASLSASRTTAALRTSASIALGAFVLHQLRYLVGYGDGAGAALGAQGHAYLEAILPLMIVFATSSLVGTFVAAAFLAPRTTAARRSAGWAFCAAALLVVFGLQETVEGLLFTGHPGGLSAVLGHGGWVAIPIAVAVGGVVSLLLSCLVCVERRLTEVRPSALPRAPAVVGRANPGEARRLASEPLAFGLARRPPPLLTG
jgi:hypothetical protein